MEEASAAGAVAILVDHNMEGQAALLWEAMVASGWLALLPVRLMLDLDQCLGRGRIYLP